MRSDLRAALSAFSAQAWAMDPRRLEAFRAELCQGVERLAAMDSLDVPAAEAKPLYRLSGSVAVLDVVGPILKGEQWILDYFKIEYADTERLRAGILAAQEDPAVKGILLWIDSPGGTISGVAQVADAVYQAGSKRFPVVAAVDDLCCSAAYWIASQAGRIYANDTASVGSIGVYAVVDDFSRLYENAGVSTHVFASGPAKGQGTEYSERPTPLQMESIRAEVQALAEIFTAAIARGRGMRADQVRKLATGDFWLASEARDNGLIDAVLPADQVLETMTTRLS